MKRQDLQKGFTLVEALVAISILMIAIASPMTLAQKGLSTATLSKDQMIAAFLAQDGIETIKNVRDQVAVSGTEATWLGPLEKCVCDPSKGECDPNLPNIKYCIIDATVNDRSYPFIKNGSGTSLNSQFNIEYDNANNVKTFVKYYHSDAAPTIPSCAGYVGTDKCYETSKFIRAFNIILDPNGKNPNEAQVNLRVIWNYGRSDQQNMDISDFIYNYSENY